MTGINKLLFTSANTLIISEKILPQNADKVKKEILRKISELLKRPEIHNPDKYKLNNSGDYRAFEVYRLRIAYFVKKDKIIITRVRSTDQEPLSY